MSADGYWNDWGRMPMVDGRPKTEVPPSEPDAVLTEGQVEYLRRRWTQAGTLHTRQLFATYDALNAKVAELTEQLQVEKELRQMERGTLRRLANELHCYASCPDAYRERQMTRPIPRRSDAELLALLTRAEAERKMVHLSTESEILEGRQMGHLDDEDYCAGMRAWFVLEAYEEPRADDGPITAWPVCCGRRACRELRDRITTEQTRRER